MFALQTGAYEKAAGQGATLFAPLKVPAMLSPYSCPADRTSAAGMLPRRAALPGRQVQGVSRAVGPAGAKTGAPVQPFTRRHQPTSFRPNEMILKVTDDNLLGLLETGVSV